MKWISISIVLPLFLFSCNPQKQYNSIIEKIGYIAYRTPLDSVGVGTIVKGKPDNLIIYTKPEQCLPEKNPDGTATNLKWVSDTDLPQQVKEVKVDFSADLAFFGAAGNPIFEIKPTAHFVSKVSVKFSNAQVEFINEMNFWAYYKSKMSETCKNAMSKFPIFWKTLKVNKMEYIFSNEAGGSIKLDAPAVQQMLNINVDVSWSIKDDYTLVIDTPKYIGFLAAQLTKESINEEQMNVYSNRLNAKGEYIWETITAKTFRPSLLKTSTVRPLH